MKKLLLSTVALAGLTAGAMAADLPARRVAPAPFAAVPVFTWTGFYVGVNVGAAWNGNNRNDFNGGFFDNGLVATSATGAVAPVFPANGGTFGFGNGIGFNNGRNNDVGILGGLQIGYNWQVTPGNGLVLGVEADVQAIGNSNRNRNGFVGFNNGGFGNAIPSGGATAAAVIPATTPNVAFFNNGGLNINGNGGSDWFATARIRVGYAFDRFMLYGTGGVAFKDDRNRNNGFAGGGFGAVPAAFFLPGAVAGPGLLTGPGFVTNGNRNNNVGWAVGVGGEYAFTNNLSAKIEYLHLGFDRGNNNGLFGNSVVGVTSSGAAITRGNGFGFGNSRNRNDVDLVRVGLNFRFGM